jgi:hypothetical protein
MLNKLEGDWIIPTRLPATQPFTGGEQEKRQTSMEWPFLSIGNGPLCTETPATSAMTKGPPKDLPIAQQFTNILHSLFLLFQTETCDYCSITHDSGLSG